MNFKKILPFSFLFFICLTSQALANNDELFQISKHLEIFNAAYKELSINYVTEINNADLFKKGINSMLNDLDPYTEYIPEGDIEDYRLKYVSTQYGGIGTSIIERNGDTYIAEVYEGYPAQKNDIRAGDKLLKINGISLKNKKTDDVSSLLKGNKGTSLTILIERLGTDTLIEKKIMRDEVKQTNVSYTCTLKNNIGYIKLDKFLENSADEVKTALQEYINNKKQGIVLDLRNNGGGLLAESVKIVNLFVEKDITIVSQQGKNIENPIYYRTTTNALDSKIPLVVLINENSASASEIVAGALQDLDRAIIIGQRSFGKGLVQQTFPLPYNSLIKLTVAKYYIPSGRCIQSINYEKDKKNTTDSLIQKFKTQKGRVVFDGNGIYPDVFVNKQPISEFSQFLISNFLIFDYATLYRSRHSLQHITESFKFHEEDYKDFISFVTEKSTIIYQSHTDRLLKELKKELANSKNISIQKEFDLFFSKLSSDKKRELLKNTKEVIGLLEAEIISRYLYESGKLKYYLVNDEEVEKATKIIVDTVLYTSVLDGSGDFKTIGNPTDLRTQKEKK